MALTTAVDTSNNIWQLGYVFNYNTNIGDLVIPQVAAVWWKQDQVKTPKNFYSGNTVDASQPDVSSVCYYGDSPQSGSYLKITPTFG